MSNYRKFVIFMILIATLIIVAANLIYAANTNGYQERIHCIEGRRVALELQDKNKDDIDLSVYKTIVNISEFGEAYTGNNDYMVEEVNGTLYRIEYKQTAYNYGLLYMNGAIICMAVLLVGVLFYIEKKIIKPFQVMSSMTTELAKGNLSTPVREEKSRYFGRFLWGIDMLREQLEADKEKELAFQKEKKILILSLSHDIKTPLSAMKLYTKAISEGLYDTKEERAKAIEGINRNICEMEKYINEIVTASREDFLNLEVTKGEFYYQDILKTLVSYYREKLSVIYIVFDVEQKTDCMIKGDRERMLEVLQNVMENAIKYGDGRHIGITSEDEEDCRLVSISNTGCSVAEEELPNIFDSFYRGKNSANVKGSGLGLYICKQLMKKMDGDIFARIEKDEFVVTIVMRKA